MLCDNANLGLHQLAKFARLFIRATNEANRETRIPIDLCVTRLRWTAWPPSCALTRFALSSDLDEQWPKCGKAAGSDGQTLLRYRPSENICDCVYMQVSKLCLFQTAICLGLQRKSATP